MIINRNAIHNDVLKKTINQEVRRLNQQCSQRHISALRQKIVVLQEQISYQTYLYGKSMQNHKNEQQQKTYQMQELQMQKKQKDLQLQELFKQNRHLLSKLRHMRQSVADQIKNNQQKELESKNQLFDEEQSNNRLSKLLKRKQEKISEINSTTIAKKLCKREIQAQKENIEHLKTQILIEKDACDQIQKKKVEIRLILKAVHEEKRLFSLKAQNQRSFLEQNQLNQLREGEQIKEQKREKVTHISNIEKQIQGQNQKIMIIQREQQSINRVCSNYQSRIVKNMELQQQISAQLFDLRLRKTDSKIKISQSTQKLQRLKGLKLALLSLIN